MPFAAIKIPCCVHWKLKMQTVPRILLFLFYAVRSLWKSSQHLYNAGILWVLSWVSMRCWKKMRAFCGCPREFQRRRIHLCEWIDLHHFGVDPLNVICKVIHHERRQKRRNAKDTRAWLRLHGLFEWTQREMWIHAFYSRCWSQLKFKCCAM
jgi:hypothetical protein